MSTFWLRGKPTKIVHGVVNNDGELCFLGGAVRDEGLVADAWHALMMSISSPIALKLNFLRVHLLDPEDPFSTCYSQQPHFELSGN
jgi:hypothetical protein